MKKLMGTLALVTMANMAYADVDMTAMHKQLNIMNNIVRTSLNEVGAESGYGIGQLESLYLAGQGVVFSMQTSSHSRYSGGHPFRISAPHVPVAPVPPVVSVIEQEVVAEVEAQEMVMRTLETSAMNYEQAIEAMEQAREIAREIREQRRDVTYDLRDVEREIRDKRYQEKHLAKDKDALKELKSEIKQLEKEQKSLREQKRALSKKNEQQSKLRKEQLAKQKEIKQAYQAQVQLKFAETLCGYGNSLKALPKGEKISLVVKRGGEQVKSRYLDKVYIFNKSDVLKCVVDDIDAKSLLAKATQYSF